MSDLGTQSELILNKNFIHEEEDVNEDLKVTEDSLKINEDSSGVHTNSYNTFESDATKITELDMGQKAFQFEELPSRDSNEPMRSQESHDTPDDHETHEVDHEGDNEADDESADKNYPEESPISEAFYEATEGETGQRPTNLRDSEDEVDDMAQQILKSASSIRNSQSEERLKQCQHSSILSPRFSLTDSQLIEEQTRISFHALFGQPIPPDSDDHPIVEQRKSTGFAMDGISNPAFNADDIHPSSERPLTTIPSYESTEEGARQPTDSPTKEVKSEDLLSTFEAAPTSFYKSKSESDHDMVNPDFLTNQIQPAQSAQIYVSSSMLSSNISDDVFRDNSERALPLSATSTQEMTTDSPYFKFPSVQKTSEAIDIQTMPSSDLASSQEEEIEKVAYEFSLRVIHECINELNNEIVIMNDLEEKAKELFTQTIRSSTEDICGSATEQSSAANVSNQSTLYTGFVSSSIEGTTPDRNDYISKWMEDQAQITNYDDLTTDLTTAQDCEEKQCEEDTYSPEDAQKSSSYDSSDDEEDRVITLSKNMYGSFDETKREPSGLQGHTPQDPSPRVSEWQGKSLDQSEASAGSRPEANEDALNSKINKLIIDIVSDAVCELQSECRFESDLSRKTADVVLEILAEAIQIGREPQTIIRSNTNTSDIADEYKIPTDTEETSTSTGRNSECDEQWRGDREVDGMTDCTYVSSDLSGPGSPSFKTNRGYAYANPSTQMRQNAPRLGTNEFCNLPTDSIDIYHHRQSNKSALKSPVSPRNSTDITASRKSSVTFGQCEIHHLR